MGQMCDLLIQKVEQSIEPEVCKVYESGQSWVVEDPRPQNLPLSKENGDWRVSLRLDLR